MHDSVSTKHMLASGQTLLSLPKGGDILIRPFLTHDLSQLAQRPNPIRRRCILATEIYQICLHLVTLRGQIGSHCWHLANTASSILTFTDRVVVTSLSFLFQIRQVTLLWVDFCHFASRSWCMFTCYIHTTRPESSSFWWRIDTSSVNAFLILNFSSLFLSMRSLTCESSTTCHMLRCAVCQC